MNTSADLTATGAQLQRMEDQLTDINARIVRLAMALGVSLDSERDIQAALTNLQAPPVQVERRHASDRRGALRGGSDRRLGASRLELRGLLVLRYGSEARFVELVGATSTRLVMEAVEHRLERQGFEPGSDGARFDGASGAS